MDSSSGGERSCGGAHLCSKDPEVMTTRSPREKYDEVKFQYIIALYDYFVT